MTFFGTTAPVVRTIEFAALRNSADAIMVPKKKCRAARMMNPRRRSLPIWQSSAEIFAA
jgi:hypothetical protein